MIICVYLNPTIDKTVYLDRLVIGGTNRPTKVIMNGAGKGINAAVVLKELKKDVKVMGILHKSYGTIIKDRLEAKSIFYDFLEIDGQTRVNTKIFDEQSQVLTEINESGTEIAMEFANRVADEVVATAKSDDMVILTGSIPLGCEKNVYAKTIEKLNEKGVRCVLDADGEALRLGILQKPYFIKPNIDELKSITQLKSESISDVLEACRNIIQTGVKVVAVSMGGDGALIVDENKAYFAKPQKVEVKSTVGAGDSMVAGIAASIDEGIDAALRAGVAAATASITLEGTELCTLKLYEKFYDKIEMIEV
ncbi:MAG: 1-phosphofructokinase family hexose kinase [Christensenellaceae bacterium]